MTDETVTPLFIGPADERYRETARELTQLSEDHLGESKGGLEDVVDGLTVTDTDYKIVQGLAKLPKGECKFEVVASVDLRETRRWLLEKTNGWYPIARQPTLGEDTQKLEAYSAIADELGTSLEDCYRGVYIGLEDNKRLVRIGTRTADRYEGTGNASLPTMNLTDSSTKEHEHIGLTVDWLLTRYNLAFVQAVLYDATEMWIRVWDHFGAVSNYVKLFGLTHRIYPINADDDRISSTGQTAGHGAVLDGSTPLFSESQKYGIRMANFLPAPPLCDRWEMTTGILVDETINETRQLALDQSEGLDPHYSDGKRFDNDVERMLAQKQGRANTDWELIREDDVSDLGAEMMIPDFIVEHLDGRRTTLEIVRFWTSEYLESKLEEIRRMEAENSVLVVLERLECANEDFGSVADCVLWSKTRIHTYDMVEMASRYAIGHASVNMDQ